MENPDLIQSMRQTALEPCCASPDNTLLARSYPHSPSSEASGANQRREEAIVICHLMTSARPILRQRMSLLQTELWTVMQALFTPPWRHSQQWKLAQPALQIKKCSEYGRYRRCKNSPASFVSLHRLREISTAPSPFLCQNTIVSPSFFCYSKFLIIVPLQSALCKRSRRQPATRLPPAPKTCWRP